MIAQCKMRSSFFAVRAVRQWPESRRRRLVFLRPAASARRAIFIGGGGGGVAFLVAVGGVSSQLNYVMMLDREWFYRQ